MSKSPIVFATANEHKIAEVKKMLPAAIEILGLEAIGCTEEIPETQATIEGNALQKAQYVRVHYQVDCFAEDTGLEIFALDMQPGVFSARYAGPDRDPAANMDKVLQLMAGKTDRRARFKTVIALLWEGQTLLFEGIVNGIIRSEKAGSGGFGYDPIFQPDGYEKTFAELPVTVKNEISHRGKAVRQLVDFLSRP